MDLKAVATQISTDDYSTRLHLGHWTKNGMETVSPSISDKLAKKIKEIVIQALNKKCGLHQTNYNVVGADDDVVETTLVTNYKENIDEIIGSIATPNEAYDYVPDNFDFYIYEFNSSKDKDCVYAFRRIKKMKFLKKGFVGSIVTGYFNDIDDCDLIGADEYIDFIVHGTDVAILQHIAFERILKLKSEFTKLAEKVLSNKTFSEKIDGFDKLKEGALQNGNYVKRLSKLDDNNRATLFLDDLDKTKLVLDKFNLDIKVEQGKICYTDSSQLGTFVSLMQDAYYQTLIGSQLGVDPRLGDS